MMRARTLWLAMSFVAVSVRAYGAEKPIARLNRWGVKVHVKGPRAVFEFDASAGVGALRAIGHEIARVYTYKRQGRQLDLEVRLPRGGRDGWGDACSRMVELLAALEDGGVSGDAIGVQLHLATAEADDLTFRIVIVRRRTWLRRMGDNIATGVKDVITAPVEVPRQAVRQTRRRGVKGAPVGVLRGFGSTLRKAGTGAIRLLTFWAD